MFVLISGGASALMPLPADGISLEDIQSLTKLLLDSGLSIGDMNAIRKHVSGVNGGRLGLAAVANGKPLMPYLTAFQVLLVFHSSYQMSLGMIYQQ